MSESDLVYADWMIVACAYEPSPTLTELRGRLARIGYHYTCCDLQVRIARLSDRGYVTKVGDIHHITCVGAIALGEKNRIQISFYEDLVSRLTNEQAGASIDRVVVCSGVGLACFLLGLVFSFL